MKFFGVIEAEGDTPFMLHMPILGLGVMDDGRYCMGHITGDLQDIPTSGHISSWHNEDFKQWVDKLITKFPEKNVPKNYKIEVCTYVEACKKALDAYADRDFMGIHTIGGPVVKINLTSIKNKLEKIIQLQ
jgi:hypothetical protein